MRPERNPVPRAQNPWGWLAGILTLGVLMAGAFAAAIALWENVDIQRLTRAPGDGRLQSLPEPEAPPPPATPREAFQVALYLSEATAGYFPEQDFYPSILGRWEGLVREAGGVVHTVRTASEVDALAGEGLLLAPSAVCLAQPEVDAFRRHAAAGGGLLITWATGARDGRCEWRGWSVVQDLTAAADVRELEQREGLFLSVPGGLPLSGGIETAARMEIRWDSPLAVANGGSRVYWSDWALNPAPAAGTDSVDGAASIRSLDGGGRIVWFGFMEDLGVAPMDQKRVQRLLTNGILWAAGVPSATLLPWPQGSQAALVLAQEVAGEFSNVRHLAELVSHRKVPATYFVVSRIARDYPHLAGLVQGAGEVASQTSDNSSLVGLPLLEQRTRLRRSVTEIQEWTSGPGPLGLRAPEEAADMETIRAWRSLGGTYVVALNNSRTGSPEVFETEEGRIALLPRVIKDDYNLLVQDRVFRSESLTNEFLRGLEKIRALGGLAVMTAHGQLSGTERYVGAVAAALDSAQTRGGWWFATGTQVAAWTLARHETTLNVAREASGRIEIEVRAPIDRALPGAWIDLTLPEGRAGRTPAENGLPIAYGESPWGIVIPLDDLLPGQLRTIVVERSTYTETALLD